jgi:hypothetical protein
MHLDWRNIRCGISSYKPRRGREPIRRAASTCTASQMKVEHLAQQCFAPVGLRRQGCICDTAFVFCFPCEHIAVFGPPFCGGPF